VKDLCREGGREGGWGCGSVTVTREGASTKSRRTPPGQNGSRKSLDAGIKSGYVFTREVGEAYNICYTKHSLRSP